LPALSVRQRLNQIVRHAHGRIVEMRILESEITRRRKSGVGGGDPSCARKRGVAAVLAARL
jgi:hypothetical protein